MVKLCVENRPRLSWLFLSVLVFRTQNEDIRPEIILRDKVQK